MSITIEKGQLFKRMYCHHCGTKLKTKTVVFHGIVDPEKWNDYIKKEKKRHSQYNISVSLPSSVDRYIAYECPKCGSITTPKTQRLTKLQKIYSQ